MSEAINHRAQQKPHLTPLEGEKFGEVLLKGLEILKPFFFGRVLDVGCGDGYGTKLIGTEHKVVGVDLEPECVLKTRERGLKAICAPQEKLPLKDQAFDCYFSSHTLEHTFDLDKTLAEMRRVARRAILIVPIEYPKARRLESHTHTFLDKDYLIDQFSEDSIIYEEMVDTPLMPELLLVVDFK